MAPRGTREDKRQSFSVQKSLLRTYRMGNRAEVRAAFPKRTSQDIPSPQRNKSVVSARDYRLRVFTILDSIGVKMRIIAQESATDIAGIGNIAAEVAPLLHRQSTRQSEAVVGKASVPAKSFLRGRSDESIEIIRRWRRVEREARWSKVEHGLFITHKRRIDRAIGDERKLQFGQARGYRCRRCTVAARKRHIGRRGRLYDCPEIIARLYEIRNQEKKDI